MAKHVMFFSVTVGRNQANEKHSDDDDVAITFGFFVLVLGPRHQKISNAVEVAASIFDL